MDDVHRTIKDFLKDYDEYLPPEIPVLHKPPTAIEFLNNHVHQNSPVIIKPEGGFFPKAQKDWQVFAEILFPMRERCITVAATPDGRADSIVDDKFMIPEEKKMCFAEYISKYFTCQSRPILYVQKQNNNLIDEFGPLLPLVSRDVPWATEAFGTPPDAANIWMGDQRSFTTMHKDYYENIYFVITGAKIFTLYPPTAIYWMPYRKVPKFQWHYSENGKWGMTDLKEEVNWIRPDLQPDTREKFHLMAHAKSYTVQVNAGEALYLPAMWFHDVKQTDCTIAVNYWYDMSYGSKFPYYCLVDALGKLPISRKDASTDIQLDLEFGLADEITKRFSLKDHQKHLGKKK